MAGATISRLARVLGEACLCKFPSPGSELPQETSNVGVGGRGVSSVPLQIRSVGYLVRQGRSTAKNRFLLL